MSSFSIALSGLNADSAALDVVGNNLANLNTTGYKDSNVSFYDLLQQSVAGGSTQIGGGVSAPQTERMFSQGSIQANRRELRRSDPRATDSSSYKTLPGTPCIRAPATSTSTPTAIS